MLRSLSSIIDRMVFETKMMLHSPHEVKTKFKLWLRVYDAKDQEDTPPDPLKRPSWTAAQFDTENAKYN